MLGSRIREARKAMGLSQEQAALEADIDRSFMGQVERGQRNVSISTLLRLARVLDVNLGSWCEGLGGIGVAEGVTPYRTRPVIADPAPPVPARGEAARGPRRAKGAVGRRQRGK
jgi:transcriptional regulator with XRE-family HTH domain